jgi:beta-ureidopropionase / N-carbamoyl-L-amino-acid hydrolase
MIDMVNCLDASAMPTRLTPARRSVLSRSARTRATRSPGHVFFTVDFRHPEDAVLTEMDRDLRQACENAASAIGLEVEVKEFWYFPATRFHPDLVAAVRDAAAPQADPHQDIISGAGHDAV